MPARICRTLLEMGVLALAGLALPATPTLAQGQPFYAPPPDLALKPYVSTADSVMLPDGRRLHFVCMGKGSPTVILTAGLGDWAGSAWAHFQPGVARLTHVCSWDRPGFGLSDGRAAQETVATNAVDLETALSRSSILGPYVMVGHSLGAFETLLFTDRNRDKVVGMVLIDPSYPDMAARAARLREQFHLTAPPASAFAGPWSKCAEEVRSGALRNDGPDPDKCVAFSPTFPRNVKAALRAQYTASPLQFETAAAFVGDLDEQSKIAINPARSYGAMPLVVLTSTVQPATAPGSSPPDPALAAASQAVVEQAHAELAALSTRGRDARIPGADHYIQRSRPQAALDAIEAVIREARERAAK